jgi:hypothetical protein
MCIRPFSTKFFRLSYIPKFWTIFKIQKTFVRNFVFRQIGQNSFKNGRMRAVEFPPPILVERVGRSSTHGWFLSADSDKTKFYRFEDKVVEFKLRVFNLLNEFWPFWRKTKLLRLT